MKKVYIGLVGWLIMLTLASCQVKQEEEKLPQETEEMVKEAVTEVEEVTTEKTEATSETTVVEEAIVEEVVEDVTEEPVDYEALKVNELGDIMVVMYHGISDNPPYQRTATDFLKDLTYMYDQNYRLIPLSDYVKQTIDIEAGMTPIVFSFDDGLATTFSLKETNGQLEVVEGTAVAILETFLKDHPDFGTGACMFLHATNNNYKGDGTQKERLQWLLDHGYEIGNHTATHANLSKLNKEKVIEEIGRVDAFIGELFPEYEMNVFTYPFGARPKKEYRDSWQTATYKDRKMSYVLGLREGPSGKMLPPMHKKFQWFNAPRVRGSEGAEGDMTWFFNYYDQEHPELKYISDGNKMTLVVPEKSRDNINEQLIGDLEIITY